MIDSPPAPTSEPGTVYLIHFDSGLPCKHNSEARHYLGWAKDLDARLAQHGSGTGSSLMAEVARRGIGWRVVRTWSNVDRHFEKLLKARKETPRFCPVCTKLRTDNRGLLRTGGVELCT